MLFVCENNQFATEVPFAYAAGNPDVASRAAATACPASNVDGNDVLAIHAAARRGRRACASGRRRRRCSSARRTAPGRTPRGWAISRYRTREDVEEWKAKCPIDRLRASIVAERNSAASELDAIDTRSSERECEAAQREAEASAVARPGRPPATHVYAEPRAARQLHRPPTRVASSRIRRRRSKRSPRRWPPIRAIFVLGEGIGERGGNFKTTAGLYDSYGPERLRDTPICERGFVGLGCGAAMTGTRPVIDFMFADFVLDGVGEIVNQIAKMQYMSSGRLKMPILLRGCIGIGHSAATHHSGNYYPLFAHFPGLRVVVPSTPYDAKGLLHHALRCDDPVLFLEHRELLEPQRPGAGERHTRSRSARPRSCAKGRTSPSWRWRGWCRQALEAAETLAREGMSVEVIDPRTVAPLDVETIGTSVAKTGRLLIVDEAFGPYGIGAEIAAQVADRYFDELDAPIRRLNGLHTPTPYSPPLEAAVVPDTDGDREGDSRLLAE